MDKRVGMLKWVFNLKTTCDCGEEMGHGQRDKGEIKHVGWTIFLSALRAALHRQMQSLAEIVSS